jgi:carnitine O-acetyltransferase
MSIESKVLALRAAASVHSKLVKECAHGKGVDRHLFALKSIAERQNKSVPFFASKAWKTLNHTILSTSNCGNPSLRLFGFGPVVADGFGIGYIIKDRSIYFSISSKHRQTNRYANTLESTLRDMGALFHRKKKTYYSNAVTKGTNGRGGSTIFKCAALLTHDDLEGNDEKGNDVYGDLWGLPAS